MVSKFRIILLFACAAVALVLGWFFIWNANYLWQRYQKVIQIRIPTYEAYVHDIVPTVRAYEQFFHIYWTAGLVLTIAGLTILFLTLTRIKIKQPI